MDASRGRDSGAADLGGLCIPYVLYKTKELLYASAAHVVATGPRKVDLVAVPAKRLLFSLRQDRATVGSQHID